MELEMKKFLDLKAVTFGVWTLKTSLRQFGSEACWQGTYQAISSEP